MEEKNSQNNGLKPVFTPLGMWAFSIGTSIGWGSFIVTCNTYLQKSGILGTIFGLVAGMAVIIVITWNLQHMIRYSPDAGGIYTFEKKAAGKDVGFVTFWFVLLTYLAILWANITSVPLFCRFFLGDTFRFGFHYTVFGYEVWFGETLLSICAIVLIGLLCIRSSRIPNRIMVVSAIVFAAGFTVCAVIALFLHDNSFSYSPLYTSGSTDFAQIVRIAAISPWAFIGFENISHFSGEYAFPLKRVRRILIWSVVLTTALYIFVSLLSISAYPPEYGSWLEYIGDMGNLEGIKAVPAFYAAQYYLGQTGVVVLMLSLFAVILTSLIGNLLALSRLLYAAGRDGEAPGALSELNKHGIPAKAILAVVAVSVVIPFLGRTAIGWIVDVTTLGATMIYGLLSYAVFRHAGSEGRKPERYTGMLGMLLMGFFLILLLVPGILPFNAMETASYALFIVWSLIGLVYFRVLTMRRKHSDYGQRIVVWIILLVLVLFAAMMWVSRVTERTAQDAVEQIYEYHESHEGTENAVTAEQRKSFLESQADRIGNTNILYTIVSLGLFMLSTGIILHNYRDTRKISEQLAVTEEAKRSAEKIASLRESISSLLDNMPGLNFAKDADTGVYLACNQAFAEYANKEDPHGVVGLADSDIFDAETAEHFREDDRMALSMDKPYIFFEDVADAGGKNRRQLQTTKLKYTDDQGRLCILGMCQDVTELVRVQRENATTKEAYEQARKNTIIFTHIAQTLAGGYTELYYVNVDTGEFTEYIPGANGKMLIEERHDFHFFEKSKADAEKYVHPDDREKVIDALNKRSLLDAIAETGTFTLTYRVLTEGGRITNELLQKYDAELTTGEDSITTYVTMRGSRMEDDENCIVLAVLDVDEEVKARRAAERMKEESIAYGRINALSGDFLCVYVVVPETGRYREYSASSGYEMFSICWTFLQRSKKRT